MALRLWHNGIRLCDVEVDTEMSNVTAECRCETTYLLWSQGWLMVSIFNRWNCGIRYAEAIEPFFQVEGFVDSEVWTL